MAKAKRNKDVKACPNADRWLREHPDVARNLTRIIRLMDARYEGNYQGYINRNEKYVEYRFDPVAEDPHIRHIQLIARKKHVVVRFIMHSEGPNSNFGESKKRSDGYGKYRHVLEFPITAEEQLDELESFLSTTTTFSRSRTSFAPTGSTVSETRDGSEESERRAFEAAMNCAEQSAAKELDEPIDSEENGRVRAFRSVLLRRGQTKFRNSLLSAYAGRCAVTDCTLVEILEAAHIVPYSEAGTHRCDNGLLLRADIHTLFDLGLLWINSRMEIELAKNLQHTEYWNLKGKALRRPTDTALHPHPEHLKRHARRAAALRAD